MRFATAALIANAITSAVFAFPSPGKRSGCPFEALHKREDKRDLIGGLFQPLSGPLANLDLPTPQPQGLAQIPAPGDKDHEYRPPGPTDVRGVCPTLNALANHGFLNRSGITTFAESANAVQTVFGFDFPLSVALAALGVLAGGDLVTGKYSIAGKDSRVPNSLQAIGAADPLGIDTHSRFEIDGSFSRADAYFGNDHAFNQTIWNELVDITKKYNNTFGSAAFKESIPNRYAESKATNPQFSRLPKSFVVAYAASAFVYRGLPNGTTQDLADYPNIAPWFLEEKIPDNWYRRGDPYQLADLPADILDLFLAHPQLEILGSNQGLNNFVPFNLDIPREAPALGCFIFEALYDAGAQQLSPATEFIQNIVEPLFGSAFNCNTTTFTTDAGSGSGVNNPTNATDSGSGSGISSDTQYPANRASS